MYILCMVKENKNAGGNEMENAKRFRIIEGSKKIGDKIGDHVITGLGRSWSVQVTDEDACAYGMEPGLDYYPAIRMQYAYVA